MRLLEIVVLCAVLVPLASLAAVYSYGQFARRVRGAPSYALPVSPEETALDRAIRPLTDLHEGQSGMILLPENLEAFAVRAHSARTAGRSLDLQYYYWKDDLTGTLLAHEIVAAADRGVRVRLLLDDINTRTGDRTYLALDAHPNIELRLFNPTRARSSSFKRGIEMVLRAFSTTRRMHNKAWIADGRLAIVGGRNIGDAYFDAADRANFHDMDVMMVGDAVPQAQAVFDQFWNSSLVVPIRALSKMRSKLKRYKLPKLRENLRRAASSEASRPYLDRLRRDPMALSLISGEPEWHWIEGARIVADPPEKATGARQDDWLGGTIMKTLAAGRAELQIISPYFIPGDRGVKLLSERSQAGCTVAVLTNSLAATDVVAVHGGYAPYRRPLLEAGIELFELRPQARLKKGTSLFGSSGASLHTKAFVVDQRTGFVGSFNFDPRSISLNTEMGVMFDDPELAAEVSAVFATQTGEGYSYAVALVDNKMTWLDGNDQVGPEPGASPGRRFAAALIRLLPLESQL